MSNNLGRNEPCFCGSGKKYKKCCMLKKLVVEGEKMIYQRLRETEGRVMKKIDSFFIKTSDEDDLFDSWVEFLSWPEYNTPNLWEYPESDNMFTVWRYFHWFLDGSCKVYPQDKSPENNIALGYLVNNSVNPLEKEWLNVAIKAPWCFYQIMSVVEGQTMSLKNLLTDERIKVVERQASRTDMVGSMLFTTVIGLHNISMMLGAAPYPLNQQQMMTILNFKEAISVESGTWDQRMIFEYNNKFFEYYWEFRNQLLNPVMPKMQNTEGDKLEMHRLVYQLDCSPEEALSKLKSLAIGWNDGDFQQEKSLNEAGQLVHISFPWLKKEKNQNAHLGFPVLGHLTLNEQRLEVEVNSRERVSSIKRSISQRFKKGQIKFLLDEIQDMQSLWDNAEPIPENSKAKSAEMVAMQDDFEKNHWQHWVDQSLIVLDDMTPRECVKSKQGRSRVESLLCSLKINNDEHEKWLYRELDIT